MQHPDEVWGFEFSVHCGVSKNFAWDFWTNVRNWTLDSDVESVELEGPFRTGARGVTVSKTSGGIEWRVADAKPGRAVIEFSAPGVVATFTWTFADARPGVRITQRASLRGEAAAGHVESFGRALEAGMPAGMRKLCEAMQVAARSRSDSASPSGRS